MLIWVDGYNVIRRTPLAELEGAGLEPARERLIELLKLYRRRRGHDVVAVFDGRGRGDGPARGRGSARGGSPAAAAVAARGVRVLYAASADDLIAANARPGQLVVSSDRDLCRRAQQAGATCAPADVFWRRMLEAVGELRSEAGRSGRSGPGSQRDYASGDAKFELDEAVEEDSPERGRPPGRRLSRAERRRRPGLRRL